MSGAEIVGVIVGLWPIAVDLAKAYQEMSGGSSALSTQVLVARTVYDQTVKALLSSVMLDEEIKRLVQLPTPGEGRERTPWDDTALAAKVRAGLGSETWDAVVDILGEMKKYLDKIITDLGTILSFRSKDTPILGKIRSTPRAVKASLPGTGILATVKHIHRLNKDIRRLLDRRPAYVVTFQEYQATASAPAAVPGAAGDRKAEDRKAEEEAANFYRAIQAAYKCGCDKAHVTSVGCHCAACTQVLPPLAPSSPHEWKFGLLIPHEAGSPAGVPHVMLLEPHSPAGDAESASIEDLCSLLEEAAAASLEDSKVRDIVSGSKRYRMRVSKMDTGLGKPYPRFENQAEDVDEPAGEPEKPAGEPEKPAGPAPVAGAAPAAAPPSTPPPPVTPPAVPVQLAPPDSPRVHGDVSSNANSAIEGKGSPGTSPAGGDKPSSVRCFTALMESNSGLVTKHRRELALRLSSALLRLRSTPWIDGSWTWNDVWVTVNQSREATSSEIKDLSILFIPRDFYSTVHSAETASVVTAFNPDPIREFLDDQPVLTRLGFALIELALGKHMKDMWADYDELTDISNDKEVINILVAKKLLQAGRIADMAGKRYQDVVYACIHHRYYDLKNGHHVSLMLDDESFPRVGNNAIISPLFDVYKGFVGEIASPA